MVGYWEKIKWDGELTQACGEFPFINVSSHTVKSLSQIFAPRVRARMGAVTKEEEFSSMSEMEEWYFGSLLHQYG